MASFPKTTLRAVFHHKTYIPEVTGPDISPNSTSDFTNLASFHACDESGGRLLLAGQPWESTNIVYSPFRHLGRTQDWWVQMSEEPWLYEKSIQHKFTGFEVETLLIRNAKTINEYHTFSSPTAIHDQNHHGRIVSVKVLPLLQTFKVKVNPSCLFSGIRVTDGFLLLRPGEGLRNLAWA